MVRKFANYDADLSRMDRGTGKNIRFEVGEIKIPHGIRVVGVAAGTLMTSRGGTTVEFEYRVRARRLVLDYLLDIRVGPSAILVFEK